MREFVRRFSLRTRLTVISAVIVAIAVAAVAVAAYIAVSHQLTNQTDNALAAQEQQILRSPGRSLATPPTTGMDSRIVQEFVIGLVDTSGTEAVESPSGVTVSNAKQFASLASSAPGTQVKTTTTLNNGTRVRVLATTVVVQQFPSPTTTPYALVVARDLSDNDLTLEHLRIFLLIAGGIGVLLAAAGGLFVARSGLRPVDRLTEAAEHIARTEELDVPIEVAGDDEVARLAKAFNSMTAALASSRVRQQQLVADAGHELRTPLTSMRTNLDLLIRSERTGRVLPPEDRDRLLEDLAAQMSELGTLVGELVNLARDDRAIEPDSPLDFADVVQRAAERARLRAGDAHRVDVATTPWPVIGRPGELERAVVNLMDNAVKFSPPGAPVTVRLSSGVLTVADHGPGISAEDLPHVFERFYRSTSARGMSGSGLGLAIVAQTVQSHGGTVSLEPNPGGGTIATLTMPSSDSAAEPEHAVDASGWQRPTVSTDA